MSSQEALRNADLARALEALKAEVRKEPAQAKHRVYMFQLAAVMGDWDRALTQLNVARDMDPECLSLGQTYQELIQCEALRKQVFAGERSPLFFGEPEPWMALVMEAARLAGAGKHAEAQQLRNQALEDVPASPGKLKVRKPTDEKTTAKDSDVNPKVPFEWIADADSRLGPILEAVVNGKYYWIPMLRLMRVDFEKPTDLRDVVWLPAHFQWTNGGEAVGFVPARYPGSESAADDLIRLARKTEWQEQAPEIFYGLGQRLLSTDENEYSLFDVEQILFDAPAKTS
ncbi:MAG: virulence protein SciE type [Planctomycetia bacterium]|nr:virulence protein SciE type [Planctomycetia bacterium]